MDHLISNVTLKSAFWCFAVCSLTMLCGATLCAEEPAPGEQVAMTADLPANKNVFAVKGNGKDRRIELSNTPLNKDERETVGYWLYLPKDYASGGDAAPLLLFLHGAGERGDDINRVKVHGPPKLCEKAEAWPFITVSPQCPSDLWWNAEQLNLLLDEIVSKYNVDEDRIYVTGLSMGGFGSWAMAATSPERFAAIVPICGGGQVESASTMVNLPIWVFHGDADPVVPISRSIEMVKAIEKAGGENVQLTTYPGVGHDSWTRTYDNPRLYEWLLSKKRNAE